MIGKTKDGIYFYSIYYKDAFGVRKQKKVQNSDWTTKKEARQAMELYLAKVDGDTSRLTVEQLWQLYLENRKDHIKLKSLYTQTNTYEKHIRPFFEKRIVSEITHHDIMSWQRSLLTECYRNRYLEKIQELLRTIFNFGVKYSYIPRNPFTIDYLRNKDERKEEMSYWTKTQFDQFIEQVDDPMYQAFFSFLFWSGLRVGEAVALTVGDIDFIKGTVTVNKTYDFVHHIVTTPKTSTSYRTVTLGDTILATMQGIVEEYKSALGYSETSLLFGFNRHLAPTTIKRRQKEACALAKLPPIRIHDFRHSHVSALISLGFTSFEIAKRLGHSVTMVDNVYGHLFPETQRLMADRLDELSRQKPTISIKN